MILLIDNYDSFSYNLYQVLGAMYPDIKVIRNDEMTPEQCLALEPKGILLSPGPGKPSDAGICIDMVKAAAGRVPVLGVCLGHQSICEAFGATVSYAKELMHGKQSETSLDLSCPLFEGCPGKTKVGRYHSLAAIKETMPDALAVTARTDDGEIMAVRHRDYEIYGVQFPPESILTPDGPRMLQNWLRLCGCFLKEEKQ